MQKYTLKDIAADNFKLLTDFDIVRIHDVEAVNVRVTEKKKVVTINIGPYDYFFNTSLKSAIRNKIDADLQDSTSTTKKTKYRFAI